jgi:hypothetical protein
MGDSKTVPVDRIRIFSRQGDPLAEFRASVPRSFVIGGEGRAQFTYPTRKTDIVNEDVLNFGNWLLIQNSQLPPWVGIIDTPREWSTRNVTVSAYTPERLFSQRIGPLEEVLTGSAGSIFAGLITRVNLAEQTILRAGNIWRGGTQRQETLNPQPLNEYLKGLWERSGEDYTWVPNVHNGTGGNLTVNGNWLPFLGVEAGIRLHEGKGGGNVEAVGRILVEDGPITNYVLAYGEGETWKSKPNVGATSQTSIGRYGLRQQAVEYSGVTSGETLRINALQHIEEFQYPARSFLLNALNVGDTFQYIGLGNIFSLRLESAGFRAGNIGFSGRVRIIGMSYNPNTKNKIQLVVREVI